jgi:glycerol transport system ATP-binding protein
MSLQLKGISKSVDGERWIDDISLDLAPGSFNVLLGLTLAGKTTLMRLMAGLDKPDAGRVFMNGRDVTAVPVRKRNVAMVYQQFINYPSMTVYDNIASPLKIARLPRREIERRVREEAGRLRIEHLLDRLPGELSGGQPQRTAMARALVRDAGLLLLDEPLVNLDYKLREELREEMREIFGRRQAVVVYATTDPTEALTLGGRTAVLQVGRLNQYGPTLEVYHQPANEHLGYVFSDPPMNMVAGELDDGVLLGGGTRLPLPAHFERLPGGRYRFGVRPNHLSIFRRADVESEISAEVIVPEISGSETYIHVRHHEVDWVIQQEGVHDIAIGSTVTMYLDPDRLFAFDADGALVAAPRPLTASAWIGGA